MIDIILSHWAMLLLLAWLLVIGSIGIVNLWPRKKSASQAESPRFALRGTQRVSPTASFNDELNLTHRQR